MTVSAGPTAPVLLCNDHELVVEPADGGTLPPLLVTGLDGSRRTGGRRPLGVTASGRGHVLIAHNGAVVSFTG